MTGRYPRKLSHHAGVLIESTKQFLIYGGILGIDSNDVIYVLDLQTFNVEAHPVSSQSELKGKLLPGPRDDFSFVTSSDPSNTSARPIFLIGGFKNGMKMNDIYKLHVNQGGK